MLGLFFLGISPISPLKDGSFSQNHIEDYFDKNHKCVGSLITMTSFSRYISKPSDG
jgi:hypothetical protein